MMEVFAGFLAHTDDHIGKLLQALEETGQFENTLIITLSDNGASAEGGLAGGSRSATRALHPMRSNCNSS